MNQTDTNTEKNYEIHYSPKRLGNLVLMLDLAAAAILVFILFRFVLGISRVSGSSMSPTLSDNQIAVVLKTDRHLSQGDIADIKMPSGSHYIKRVIACPGDTVSLKNGKVYVNGELSVCEKYAVGETLPEASQVVYPLTLKDGMYFVLGDNREDSVDSRTFGPISQAQIQGRIP